MEVEVQILDERLQDWGFPAYGSNMASGLDLYACVQQAVILAPHQPAVLISSGLAISIGDGDWCGLVLPRSGLGHKKGLVLGNTVGVVDPDYRGACYISAWNRNPADPDRPDVGIITIQPGDRIAQLILVRICRPKWQIVTELRPSARGSRGFGSSG
jgi:dUTP pyrophosphatase